MVDIDAELPERRAYFEKLYELFEEHIAFNRFVGMHIERLAEGFARVRIAFSGGLVGDPYRPALHGGVLSTLLDTAGGLAAFTAVQPGDRMSTIDLRVDYVRPAGLADVIGEGRVLRLGNRVAVCDMVAFQEDPGRPVATGKGVYNLKRAGEGP